MTFGIGLTLLGATLVLSCCVALVFHAQYDDGLMGRAGLAVIGIGSFARVMQILTDPLDTINPTPIGVLIWVGMALFFCRHTWRFLYRAKYRNGTWYEAKTGKAQSPWW